MKVVITGGAGFLGKKLARRLLQDGTLAGPDGKPARVGELLLFDVGLASGPGLDDPRVRTVSGDIANFATVQSIVQGASTVFHVAAVVSAGAEADFDLGYKVNLDGTRNVLEACQEGTACLRQARCGCLSHPHEGQDGLVHGHNLELSALARDVQGGSNERRC